MVFALPIWNGGVSGEWFMAGKWLKGGQIIFLVGL